MMTQEQTKTFKDLQVGDKLIVTLTAFMNVNTTIAVITKKDIVNNGDEIVFALNASNFKQNQISIRVKNNDWFFEEEPNKYENIRYEVNQC